VIGGSAGSIEPLKVIAHNLPAGFPGSVFVVVHLSSEGKSNLPKLLCGWGALPAIHPIDRQEVERGYVYVARPDHHLSIEEGRIRVLRGPRENRHRPAIDPLFRSAAREYGSRVVGIVLSGLQDDCAAGLYSIKKRGGVAIVQDPHEAMWKDMPTHAIQYAAPDHILPTREIAPMLVELAAAAGGALVMKNGKRGRRKATPEGSGRADENQDVARSDEGEGTPSVFACPECHGVLWELKQGKLVRFRCRIGHSYGPDSLSIELSLSTEAALWAAVRALDEKAALNRRVAEGMWAGRRMSARLLDQSAADASNAKLIRDIIFRSNGGLARREPASKKKTRSRRKKAS